MQYKANAVGLLCKCIGMWAYMYMYVQEARGHLNNGVPSSHIQAYS